MRKNILAAALIAPAIAFAPASAFAHHCKPYHHHHHAKADKADKGAYGSSKAMKKDDTGTTSSGSRNLKKNQDNINKDTTGGSSGTTY